MQIIKISGNRALVESSGRGYVRVTYNNEAFIADMDSEVKKKLADDVEGWEAEMQRLRDDAIGQARAWARK